MDKVNRIRILFIVTVMFGIVCCQVFRMDYPEENSVSQTTENILTTDSVEETEKSIPVSQNQSYAFVIVEEGDYLTVYYADRKTLYEYTDIQYSNLPDEIRHKIRKGYCIKNEAELFGFLENYSS